jgi:hypothetical protein
MDIVARPFDHIKSNESIVALIKEGRQLETELAEAKEDAALWKKSESECNAQFNALESELTKLREIAGAASEIQRWIDSGSRPSHSATIRQRDALSAYAEYLESVKPVKFA